MRPAVTFGFVLIAACLVILSVWNHGVNTVVGRGDSVVGVAPLVVQTGSKEAVDLSLSEYLKTRDNVTSALCALHLVDRDPSALWELRKLANSSPEAFLFVAFHARKYGQNDQDFLNELRAGHVRFPSDPWIALSLLGIEVRHGDSEGALQILNKIGETIIPPFGSSELKKEARELLLYRGKSADEAEIEATQIETEFRSSVTHLMSALPLLLKVIPTLTPEGKAEFASNIIGVSRRLNPSEDYVELYSLSALSIERDALSKLDPLLEFGDKGNSVRDRIVEIDSLRSKASAFRETVLPEFGIPSVRANFYRNRDIVGIEKAIKTVQIKKR